MFKRGLLVSGTTGATVDGAKKAGTYKPNIRLRHMLAQPVNSCLVLPVRCGGGVALLLPAFHCAINPMELVLGRSKWRVSQDCNYILISFRENVPSIVLEAEGGMELTMAQRFCRRVINCHQLYHLKLTGPEAGAEGRCPTMSRHRRKKSTLSRPSRFRFVETVYLHRTGVI